MGHHHHHGDNTNTGFALAFSLNLFFTIVELLGGFYANSTAILSDAIHDFGDCIVLGLAWYAQSSMTTSKKGSQTYTYGLHRAKILSALLSGIILFVGSMSIGVYSLYRFYIFSFETVKEDIMLYLAALGILVNFIAFYKIHKGSKGIQSKMVSLHLLEDVLGWALVLVGAVVIYYTQWYWIDTLLSIALSIYVGYYAFKNLREVYFILMQRSPISTKELKDKIFENKEVQSICDLHIWTIDGEYIIATIHLILNDTKNVWSLKEKIRADIQKVFLHNKTHTTIEIEQDGQLCNETCLGS